MPIYTDDDVDSGLGNPKPTMPSAPKVKENTEYKSAVVETKKQPLKRLLAYAEGSRMTVNYYSQILGEDDAPRPISMDASPINQQYHLVEKFVILAQDGFTQTYNSSVNQFDVTGSGTILPGTIVPNFGDVFLVDFGDGREALVSVGEPTPLTITLDTGYSIQYKVIGFDATERVNHLNAKVVKRSIYRQELLTNNQAPVISHYVNQQLDSIDYHCTQALTLWLNQFISRKHSYIIVPEQTGIVYDYFIVSAMQRLVGTWSDVRFTKLNVPSLNEEDVFKTPSIWDVLLRGASFNSTEYFKQIALVGTQYIRGNPRLVSVFYSPLTHLVYPADNPYDVDDEKPDHRRGVHMQPLLSGRLPRPITGDLSGLNPVPPPALPVTDGNSLIHHVIKDNYYIFSEAFYNNHPTEMSVLERAIHQMLQNKAVDVETVLTLLTECPTFDALDRFYYIPVILVLAKYVRRTL